jgi:hypothetical protein
MNQISRHLETKQKYVAGKRTKFPQIQLQD